MGFKLGKEAAHDQGTESIGQSGGSFSLYLEKVLIGTKAGVASRSTRHWVWSFFSESNTPCVEVAPRCLFRAVSDTALKP